MWLQASTARCVRPSGKEATEIQGERISKRIISYLIKIFVEDKYLDL